MSPPDHMKTTERVAEHGTISGYTYRGCRCPLCRDAWATYTRERNHRLGIKRPAAVVNAERRAAVTHGSATKYKRHGCRCDECRAGEARRRAEVRRKAAAKPTPDHVHGTKNGYQNYGCRCDACREAQRLAHLDGATHE